MQFLPGLRSWAQLSPVLSDTRVIAHGYMPAQACNTGAQYTSTQPSTRVCIPQAHTDISSTHPHRQVRAWLSSPCHPLRRCPTLSTSKCCSSPGLLMEGHEPTVNAKNGLPECNGVHGRSRSPGLSPGCEVPEAESLCSPTPSPKGDEMESPS